MARLKLLSLRNLELQRKREVAWLRVRMAGAANKLDRNAVYVHRDLGPLLVSVRDVPFPLSP